MAIRICDVLLALILLIGSAPILVVIFFLWCLRIYTDPIFVQERVGKEELRFNLLKFRSLPKETPQVPTHELHGQTISLVGQMLRSTKIDEIPQAINVLRNEMSFVGPRPCLPSQIQIIQLRRECDIFSVKPGLTGYAQCQKIAFDDIRRVISLDREWVLNQSWRNYVFTILRTFLGSVGF